MHIKKINNVKVVKLIFPILLVARFKFDGTWGNGIINKGKTPMPGDQLLKKLASCIRIARNTLRHTFLRCVKVIIYYI